MMDNNGGINTEHAKYVVVGGGIAGVTCAETLSALCIEDKVLLITASPLIKAVTNLKQVTRALEDFDVEEKSGTLLETTCPNVTVVHTAFTGLDSDNKCITTSSGKKYTYDKLCICTGGSPKVIAKDSPFVLGIRDTETVKVFQEKIKKARRVVIVGNGGIATELAYEIEGCEVIWAIKDASITSTFVDAGAAEFFLPQLATDKQTAEGPLKRLKYTVQDEVNYGTPSSTTGGALGPDWSTGIGVRGVKEGSHSIHVEYKVEVKSVLSPEEFTSSGLKLESPCFKSTVQKSTEDSWPVYVHLTNGKVYGCDFVISATGVEPNVTPFLVYGKFKLLDGGLEVNNKMQTSVPHVYAAGDVCTAGWVHAPHWVQMRLWSQARQMGCYAAKCMAADLNGEDIHMDFCFELFAHVTKFFNYKVVLLGKFNAQGLGTDHELLLRVTTGEEYVKAVLQNGRMVGAILIGETDLEETFENLILNQMDLTPFKDELLNPNIDIEDFFD